MATRRKEFLGDKVSYREEKLRRNSEEKYKT